MAWLLWTVLIPVALVAAAGGEHEHPLLDLLRMNPQEGVRKVRDAFAARVRCGPQQGIAEKLCQDCLSTSRIMNMTNDGGGQEAKDVIGRASIVLFHFLLSFRTSCTPESIRRGHVGGCGEYAECRAELRSRLSKGGAGELESLEKILREVKGVWDPEPTKPCFSAEMVLNELNTGSKRYLDTLPRDIATVLLLTSHLYSGECIDVGESVADFLDDLFLHYGNGCKRVMTQSGFSKLWNDLQMQRRGKHIDHGVQKNTCFSAESPQTTKHQSVGITETETQATESDYSSTSTKTTITNTDRPSTTTVEASVDVENSTTVVVLIPPLSEEKAQLPQNSNVYVVGEEIPEEAPPADAATVARRVRHTPSYPEDHEHKNLANECLPSDALLQRFLTPGNQLITSSEFLQLCPALVQQAVSGVCSSRLKASPEHPTMNETGSDVLQQVTSQSANPWYAVASVSAITAISLVGLFLLPVLKRDVFCYVNAFFTGLAFGTMSGDVVLHLMPQYLGLHSHDGHDHKEEDMSLLDKYFPGHLQRQLVFLLTMYTLLLMEGLFEAITSGGGHKQHHGHSHGPMDIPLRDRNAIGDVENAEMKPKLSRCTKIVEFLKPTNLFSGISSKAAVIVLADTVHNFADGMAIAVGFSTSYKDGFSTSVAVFFHELPHEIGDFAVLMNCGLSYWKAFVFNLLSGLSAFLGLGVGLFTASLFREWLLCVTAGLFFFVVMGEMLPDMRLESKEKWREFVVKIGGTVAGIATMVCIAIYELSTEA